MSFILILLAVWLFIFGVHVLALAIGMIFYIWTLPPPDRSFVGLGLRWDRELQRYEAGRTK